MINAQLQTQPDQNAVLTKAFIRMAKYYQWTGKEIHELTGMSESTITRLYQGKKNLSPSTKEGEVAVLLLRIYRSLNAMIGNHHEKARLWLNHENVYFKQKPIEAMKTLSGLIQVLQYLDAMRGH